MRRFAVLALLTACDGGESAAPSEAASAPEAPPERRSTDPVPDVPVPDVSAERALLQQGPPPAPGPVTQAFVDLAAKVGAGVVRCPLVGGGRGEVWRGRASDHDLAWGLPVGLEDGGLPPWSPALDQAGSEGDWAVFLAAPGDTATAVTTRSRALRYVHPPAAAGTVVSCTGVDPQTARIVRGRVPAPRPEGLVVLPCVSPPPPIGADGTFAVLVPTPCRLWVEGGGTKSAQLPIEPGAGPLDATFELQADPMQGDGTLTADGQAAVVSHVAQVRAQDTAAKAIVSALRTATTDPSAQTIFGAMLNELHDRGILADKADRALGVLPR
jgi:hypothetical protein